MKHSEDLKKAYEEMAELTLPKCQGCKPRAYSCCDKLFGCEVARDIAIEMWGVTLKETGHPTLPFMGESGCTIEPYLRPHCTLHTCKINALGADPDLEWAEKYFKLRDYIDDLEDQHIKMNQGEKS